MLGFIHSLFTSLEYPPLSWLQSSQDSILVFGELYKACFRRRASRVPNALKTIDNQLKCLIIYCF
jgi:hypothetical protein